MPARTPGCFARFGAPGTVGIVVVLALLSDSRARRWAAEERTTRCARRIASILSDPREIPPPKPAAFSSRMACWTSVSDTSSACEA